MEQEPKDFIAKWINENPISAAGVAEKLGLSRAHFNNKLKENGRSKFNAQEIESLRGIVKQIKENSAQLEKDLKPKKTKL